MQRLLPTIRHLALIAIFMRAMIPAGWMPDSQGGLTICSVDAALGTVHHDGDPSTPSPDDSHQGCPFAAAPQLASTPDAPQLALPAVHAFIAASDREYAATLSAHVAPGAPRAPPRLA